MEPQSDSPIAASPVAARAVAAEVVSPPIASSESLAPEPAIQVRSARRERVSGWLSTVLFVGPLLLVLLVFLVIPALSVLIGAFRADAVTASAGVAATASGLTLDHIRALGQPQYVSGLKNSVLLSGTTAILGTIIGSLLAYAVMGEGGPAWLRNPLIAFSGVAANFAGVPLALAFVATLGTTGMITRLLNTVGINLYQHGFSLFTFSGLVVVYTYFQVPLMVILIAPALGGLRREWREAAENLGASAGQFWRMVGLPILAPSLLASLVLLFGNAFSAYATAYALTSGALPLLPLQIGAVLSGNVLNDPHLGQALALLVMVVMTLTMLAYSGLERLGSRWRR